MTEPSASSPDELYSLPLEQFTEARDRLAKQLSAQGDEEGAASVAKLRKPSVAAWALNLAAHKTSDAVERLLASHRRLREATSAELLQEASRERQLAIGELAEAALAELTAAGRPASAATRERINSTLLATGTDHEAEDDLAAGRLVRAVEPSGGGWGDIALAPSPKPDAKTREQAAAEQARTRADKLEAEAVKAEQRAQSAERALSEAKRRAEQARAAADQAKAEAEQAEEAAQ